MNKKTLKDIALQGKRVVMRVDFNVPIKEGVINYSKGFKLLEFGRESFER